LFLITLAAYSANAQTTRVYVADSGNDANSGAASSPFKTIIKALTVVDAGGEVIITENGDYDKFFVNKSVTVAAAPGINAGIVSGGGYDIVMVGLQSTDTVRFRNLQLKGIGDPTNSIGISNSTAGTMIIEGCTLSGFDNAIVMSARGQLFVYDTVVRNSLFGIGLIGPQGEGVLRALIDGCRLEQNDTGVAVGAKVIATIRNTVAANNTSRGIQVRSTLSGLRAEALIDNCHLTNNTVGLSTSGTNGGTGITRLTRTTITNNNIGVSVPAGGTVYTLQNTVIEGNFPDVSGALTPAQAK
jgi:hypothetical protein